MSSIIPPHVTSCHIDYSFFFSFFFTFAIGFRLCLELPFVYTLRPDDFIGSILCYITLYDIAGESGGLLIIQAPSIVFLGN